MLCAMPALTCASTTEVLPLSGMGQAGEAPVYWDFRLDAGRGAGEWRRILVPSCWEQQGFGRYYYGTEGRGKTDEDPVIPKETGTYRRSFELPQDWKGREIRIVFEAVMTDTTVFINGTRAGPVHQGGFYRFDYDITRLVKPGRNDVEVLVAKESSNKSVNAAERRGDYWTFGGIYRPVWLEARPRNHMTWIAIDARADGSFTAQVHLNRPPASGTRVSVTLRDAAGITHGAPLTAQVAGDSATVTGRLVAPALWSAETPNLYTAEFALTGPRGALHERRERFGFRTLEVRERDGVYLNDRKIVLKGINRHSFAPDTGRTLSREQNYADARLIKSANMNAVRMSHYPPDPAFLDAADELGLYVLNELAGWQGFYDAPTGARLIGQLVRRDVNHPSVLFWDNGNEGGWNADNDGEFARWDPQRRPVLHPWAIHGGINTDHYENYDSTVNLSAGPEIFMPTEFLHGLYDGGIGAGLRDYWDVMGRSPTVAGGFFWAFADEGIARTDRDGRIDNVGNAAPDGMLGPRHEKEGSYFAVRELWSPVMLSELRLAGRGLFMHLENRYDFTPLERCTLRWRVLRLPDAGETAPAQLLAEGSAALPALAPRAAADWQLDIGRQRLEPGEALEVSVHDPAGEELWTWVMHGSDLLIPLTSGGSDTHVRRQGKVVEAGSYRLEFDPATGGLLRLQHLDRVIPVSGPRLVALLREKGKRSYAPAALSPRLRKLTLAPRNSPQTIARAEFEGALRELTWSIRDDELVLDYLIDYRGPADLLGLTFDFPESRVKSKRWVGAGPYRIWKNRNAGTKFGLHEAGYSRAVPGEIYSYPEFQGFFGAWDWLEMRTQDADVVIRNLSGVPYFGLYSPAGGQKPVLELPELGWSMLHAIPPIGTKFALPDVLGPESQTHEITGELRGEITFAISR
jgi:hypothetical protein